VRRADIYSSRSSPSASEPDTELAAQLQERLRNVYGPALEFEDVNRTTVSQKGDVEPETKDEDEAVGEGFEFRLFASSAVGEKKDGEADRNADGGGNATEMGAGDQDRKSEKGIARIVLDDDGHIAGAGYTSGEGGFIVPRRDERYYFAAPATGPQKARFSTAAISGSDVRQFLNIRYTGWEVPWRVRTITLTATSTTSPPKLKRDGSAGYSVVEAGGIEGRTKKKKPGKKRRSILRLRKRKGEEAKERREKETREREEAAREKRTRRNREKKVKKRLKEKTKKAAVGGTGDGADVALDGGGDDSD
jgi:hypothetical protein